MQFSYYIFSNKGVKKYNNPFQRHLSANDKAMHIHPRLYWDPTHHRSTEQKHFPIFPLKEFCNRIKRYNEKYLPPWKEQSENPKHFKFNSISQSKNSLPSEMRKP